MQPRCSSVQRCYATICEPCAWRYSLNISRRVLAAHPRRLFAVTIEPSLVAPSEFGDWRIRARNLIDYRRRESRWWRSLGLSGWLGSDGLVRGIVNLGFVLEDEFIRAFGRRWLTTLRSIDEQDLRNEVYFAVRPGIISQAQPTGRYQSIRLVVEPRAHRLPRVMKGGWAEVPSSHPLPVLV